MDERIIKELEKYIKNEIKTGYWTRGDDEGYGANAYDCAMANILDKIKELEEKYVKTSKGETK